ncbi:MAG: glycosyltransferase [candidate division WOR-3 bacterium]
MENKKVKICIISYHTSPVASVGEGSSGGMSIFLSDLCKRISKNMEVDIFCRGKENEKNVDRCNLIYLNSMSLEEFQEKIIRFHVKKKYDIIHSHYWLSGIVAKRIKKLFPALTWVHSFHTIEALKRVTCDKDRIEKEKDIIHLCDFIVSPTYAEKRWIKESYPEVSVQVIPHGVSNRDFPFGKDESRNILFVGRVDPVKGIELLVESLKFIKGDFVLNIVGGPSKDIAYYENMKVNASRYPVSFFGKMPHKELYKIYQNSCMLVLPSYYESFGLVALEAMSCGRPVVGFSDTSLSKVVSKRAGIFVKRNTREFARAINFLLNNKSKSYDFGKQASKRAFAFNWEITSRRYIEFYKKIVREYTCNYGSSR